MKQSRSLIILGVLIGGFFATNYVLLRRADPTDCVSTLSEFLTWRPSAEQFALVEIDGQKYVLAYGFAGRVLPSGSAAYVFGSDGKLVDWSSDIGDDSTFDEKWNAQRARGSRALSRSEVTKLAATRPAG